MKTAQAWDGITGKNSEDDEEEEETDFGGELSVQQVLNADAIPEQLTENTTALVYLNQLRVVIENVCLLILVNIISFIH